MAKVTRCELFPNAPRVPYPAHLQVAVLLCHRWKGQQQVGRFITCLVCNVQSNTRNRNGDARFLKAHKRCGMQGGTHG